MHFQCLLPKLCTALYVKINICKFVYEQGESRGVMNSGIWSYSVGELASVFGLAEHIQSQRAI